jgi:hypothetical protein
MKIVKSGRNSKEKERKSLQKVKNVIVKVCESLQKAKNMIDKVMKVAKSKEWKNGRVKK